MNCNYLLVCRESVEKVINDVSSKKLYTNFISVGLSFFVDLDVEAKHDSEPFS